MDNLENQIKRAIELIRSNDQNRNFYSYGQESALHWVLRVIKDRRGE